MSRRHEAAFEVRRVEQEGAAPLAGWATPVVYVNGVEISHYTMSARKWERAIEAPLERKTLRGEVVDLDCYEESGARGPAHQDCAEHCVNELKLPVALLTAEGDLYPLVAGQDPGAELIGLKQQLGRQVEVAGELYRWEAKRTLTVREVR